MCKCASAKAGDKSLPLRSDNGRKAALPASFCSGSAEFAPYLGFECSGCRLLTAARLPSTLPFCNKSRAFIVAQKASGKEHSVKNTLRKHRWKSVPSNLSCHPAAPSDQTKVSSKDVQRNGATPMARGLPGRELLHKLA